MRCGQPRRFQQTAAPPGCSGPRPPPLPTRTSEPMTESSMLGKPGSASWSSSRLFPPPWQDMWISRESRASPCFRSVASGPGPASGEEFRRDDDGFPDTERRHCQERGVDRHPARAGEDGVDRARRGVRGVIEDLVPEDQAPAEGEEKDEQQDAEDQLAGRSWQGATASSFSGWCRPEGSSGPSGPSGASGPPRRMETSLSLQGVIGWPRWECWAARWGLALDIWGVGAFFWIVIAEAVVMVAVVAWMPMPRRTLS